jgi:hypothetical protein
MTNRGCTVSFFKNDLQKSNLPTKCPVKNCSSQLLRISFQKYIVPFCPEHNIRIHKTGFVYHNGNSPEGLATATKRNLTFNGNYYAEHLLDKNHKMESGRLCYENSEDAVSFNVFTELLRDMDSLRKLVKHITKYRFDGEIELYLWGGKIDLKNSIFKPYGPLENVRDCLEKDIKRFKTEPDIMLVIPKKIIICIEAKFGSKNTIAENVTEEIGEKPKSVSGLIDRYCKKNTVIDTGSIFSDSNYMPRPFHEQIFRNIVFAASMAEIAGIQEWYVANLRNQHVMNIKQGKPESRPVKRSVISMLSPSHKHRFTHITWEDIYNLSVKDNPNLLNLSWYLKNKSLGCGRAFNIK